MQINKYYYKKISGMKKSTNRVGIILFFILLSSSSLFLITQSKSSYNFTLKTGDSVTYRITENQFGHDMYHDGNGSVDYQITVSILKADTNNITVEINEQTDNPKNYTYSATNVSSLNIDNYAFVFNTHLDTYLYYNDSTFYHILVFDRNGKYLISNNDSEVCHSCGWANIQDNTRYIYDKKSGWLENMTESYSDYSDFGNFFFNKSVTSTNWDVKEVITSNLTYSSVNMTFFSLMIIIIVNKKIKIKK